MWVPWQVDSVSGKDIFAWLETLYGHVMWVNKMELQDSLFGYDIISGLSISTYVEQTICTDARFPEQESPITERPHPPSQAAHHTILTHN